MLEASAAICALQLAQQIGFLKVEIEGDARGVIRKLQGVKEDLSPIGTLVDVAKSRTKSFCKFILTRRKGNMAAHWLAKYRLKLQGDKDIG